MITTLPVSGEDTNGGRGSQRKYSSTVVQSRKFRGGVYPQNKNSPKFGVGSGGGAKKKNTVILRGKIKTRGAFFCTFVNKNADDYTLQDEPL